MVILFFCFCLFDNCDVNSELRENCVRPWNTKTSRSYFYFYFYFYFLGGFHRFFFCNGLSLSRSPFFFARIFLFPIRVSRLKSSWNAFFFGGAGVSLWNAVMKTKKKQNTVAHLVKNSLATTKICRTSFFFFLFLFFFFERVLWFDRCSFTDQWPILMIRRRFLLVGSLDFSNRTWNSVAVARFSLKEMETVGIDNGTTTTTKKRTAWKVGNSRLFLR